MENISLNEIKKDNGKMKHIPGLVRVTLCLAERPIVRELTVGFAIQMVLGFLPNGYIILLH